MSDHSEAKDTSWSDFIDPLEKSYAEVERAFNSVENIAIDDAQTRQEGIDSALDLARPLRRKLEHLKNALAQSPARVASHDFYALAAAQDEHPHEKRYFVDTLIGELDSLVARYVKYHPPHLHS